MTADKNFIKEIAKADVEKSRLIPNALFAIGQVIVSSVVLFLLFRFLLKQLGTEAFGVWTLVTAVTSLTNIGTLGMTGGVVRFVSSYLARGDSAGAASAVETSLISVAVVMGLIAGLMWLVIGSLLPWMIPKEWLHEASAVWPYFAIAFWISAIGGLVHSGLEGCHRSDLRSISTLVCHPLLLLGAVLLTPSEGLRGLALAQLGQYAVWALLGWWLLKRQIAQLPLVPFRWHYKQFTEMWRYGLNFQIISVLLILSEPLAKALLSFYSSLSAVTFFEMANRLITQVRALLVSANQVITPYYAKVTEIERNGIHTIYLSNLQLISLLTGALFSSLYAIAPMICVLWIGYLEFQFLMFLAILSVGWIANTLAIPAYFANLGVGNIGANVQGHLGIMLVMVLVGIILGPFFKPYGSALAWPSGLLLGSLIIDQGLLKHAHLSRAQWASNLNIRLFLVNFASGVTAGFGSLYFLQEQGFSATVMASVCVVFALAGMAVLNARKVLMLSANFYARGS